MKEPHEQSARELVAGWRGVFVYFEGKWWNESCHHVKKPRQ